ncbi:TetR/AcrR family transcriptional regulator [Microbacterium murale]|uniref:AcrR family transcriptional regulator n=1 Tax=Microbacterium murale TaxID=1081040 RepID=A0ABU0P9S0_9MICO|nr:TetR/AcrR family transcriptional regulator [Microbacterium murale]MDQ0644089.1 AcrR family transcriptional regulator [Microbacterium murale]
MAEVRAMRADARRNRDAIVAAARAAFDRGDQLRFDDFAGRAGVGVGTLYRHFPTREALAAAVYQDEVLALCECARESTGPAGEALEAFLRGFVDYVVVHAALARTLAALVGPHAQELGGSELERTVAELMDRAVADGAIREDVSSGAVMVVLHGIGSAVDRPLWASDSRAAIELLIDGITSR